MTRPALWTQCFPPKRTPKKPRRRIRRATPSRARQLAQYRREVKFWLQLQREMGVRCPVTGGMVTEVHHKFGKRGKLLLWRAGWVPVSSDGHFWITGHPKEARARGLIGALGTWNSQKLVDSQPACA